MHGSPVDRLLQSTNELRQNTKRMTKQRGARDGSPVDRLLQSTNELRQNTKRMTKQRGARDGSPVDRLLQSTNELRQNTKRMTKQRRETSKLISYNLSLNFSSGCKGSFDRMEFTSSRHHEGENGVRVRIPTLVRFSFWRLHLQWHESDERYGSADDGSIFSRQWFDFQSGVRTSRGMSQMRAICLADEGSTLSRRWFDFKPMLFRFPIWRSYPRRHEPDERYRLADIGSILSRRWFDFRPTLVRFLICR